MIYRILLLIFILPSALVFGADADYLVGERDRLAVKVHGYEDLSGVFAVGPDGAVSMPYVESVKVSGLSIADIERLIKARYADGYLVNPHISVSVAEYLSQPVEVYGAVAKAGVYFLRGTTTLREILGEAGWVQVEKSNGRIQVERGGELFLTVMLDDLLAGRGNLTVLANDVVTLPEGQFIFVDGEVAKPGAILFSNGLTVSQALTRAGGPSTFASLRNAYLLRNGERITVNIKRILGGRDADIEMRPGDQLFVKPSAL
jgi:polysaccharide export outer membrane protein